MAKRTTRKNYTNANRCFEPKLWAAAEALQNSRAAAKYGHVFPGLIFLKQGN